MGIKEIINRERWELVGGFDSEVKRHNASLDRIEAEANNLMFPTVRKIRVDVDGSVRIDFTGNWHIAMRDCHLSQLIKEATDPLHKRIAELEVQVPKVVMPRDSGLYFHIKCDCNHLVRRGAKYCSNCGAAIAQTAES